MTDHQDNELGEHQENDVPPEMADLGYWQYLRAAAHAFYLRASAEKT